MAISLQYRACEQSLSIYFAPGPWDYDCTGLKYFSRPVRSLYIAPTAPKQLKACAGELSAAIRRLRPQKLGLCAYPGMFTKQCLQAGKECIESVALFDNQFSALRWSPLGEDIMEPLADMEHLRSVHLHGTPSVVPCAVRGPRKLTFHTGYAYQIREILEQFPDVRSVICIDVDPPWQDLTSLGRMVKLKIRIVLNPTRVAIDTFPVRGNITEIGVSNFSVVPLPFLPALSRITSVFWPITYPVSIQHVRLAVVEEDPLVLTLLATLRSLRTLYIATYIDVFGKPSQIMEVTASHPDLCLVVVSCQNDVQSDDSTESTELGWMGSGPRVLQELPLGWSLMWKRVSRLERKREDACFVGFRCMGAEEWVEWME